MSEFEFDNSGNADASAGINDSPNDFEPSFPTDSGEDRYGRAYREDVYSDAHYVPKNESTVPPRYYTPPETKAKEPKPRKKKGVGRWVAVIAACLVCALLGGIGGAAIIESNVDERIANLEAALREQQENRSVLTQAPAVVHDPVSPAASGLSAASIYDMACRQVVGITSEITYQNFFGMNSSAAVSGSGFILTSDGYVLTNFHVIEDAYQSNAEINVMTHDGTKYPAAIVGFESDNDIAVLKIEAEDLDPVIIGDSDAMKVGDVVYAVGNPLGELEFSMSTGHVSAKDRQIGESRTADYINMFQLDAAVNSGNSGGPVYNDQGQVVGVVTAKYSSSGVEGLGFAIPIKDAADIANDLITKGYVTGKAYLGISIRNDYTSMYAQYYGWPMGAMVAEVSEDGCAEKAGIQAGDIITKLGDIEVESYNDLKSALRKFSAGETADVTLYRAGEELTVSVTFDEALPEEEAETQPQTNQQQQQFGSLYPFQIPGFSFDFG